jgi:hypothetical protein
VSGDPAVDARLADGVAAMRVPDSGLMLARDIFTEVTASAPSFAEGWNKVEWCRLTLSTPVWKAVMVSALEATL